MLFSRSTATLVGVAMLSTVSSLLAIVAFDGPPLQLPWACGTVESCTQGHHGGSHTGASAFAWDFVLQEGEEILAASAGVVTHARLTSDVGGCNASFATEGNYITIDHGDGTSIIYAHMQANSSPLAVGDVVEVGDLVARVGLTGYVCGAHLHMAVQEQCGASHCASVSAAFEEIGDPGAGEALESGNCPSCPRTLEGGVTVIDDQDAGCLLRETKAWWSSADGKGAHHFYTLGTDAPADVTTATWVFEVIVPGDYTVEVFVPTEHADTTHANYVVHHAAGTDAVVVDQAAHKGWQPLGSYAFVGGPDEGVTLGDATGENIDTLGRRVAYDALRFTFVASQRPDDEDTGSDDEGGSADSDSGEGGEGHGGVASTADGDASGPSEPAGSGDAALPPDFGSDDAGVGCQCSAQPDWGHTSFWMLLLAGKLPLARARRVSHAGTSTARMTPLDLRSDGVRQCS